MRIDRIRVDNFRGFVQREFSLHPEFNLIVGENGTGKTSVLEALSIAAGSWFLGLPGYDSRPIRREDVRLKSFRSDGGMNWESQFPCEIEAHGFVLGESIVWKRTLGSLGGRTTYGDARDLRRVAARSGEVVRDGEPITLPLISTYGTGRLWNVPREQSRVKGVDKIRGKGDLSRLAAYRNSVDPRISVPDLVEWIARQSWAAFQRGGDGSLAFGVARRSLMLSIPNAADVYFDAEFGEVVVEFEGGGRQPFSNLSDGQRVMLALIGDLARKAATLNPHLGEGVLSETPGIVLIDELDLHLHPTWQRRVIEDLRTTFPKLQFVCTTHSPLLIQSLRSGEELLVLDGQPATNLGDLSLDRITQGIQGVTNPQVSVRYASMRRVARDYLEILDEAAGAPALQLAAYRERLAESIAPYADNPAFQAFLEMKRAAKLGQ